MDKYPPRWPEFLFGSSVNYYQDAETELYQPGMTEQLSESKLIVAACLRDERHFSELSLNQFQAWGRTDWKEPHFSWKATERFSNKLGEEGLYEAPAEFGRDFKGQELSSEYQESERLRRISELGDVFWCANALASQVRESVEYATAHHLLDLAGKAQMPLTIGDLDLFVDAGVRPHATDNLANDEDHDHHELHPKQVIPDLVRSIRHWPERAYGYGENPIYSPPILTEPGTFRDSLGRLTYFTAYFAQRWANGSMAEVIEYNVRKLADRVATGTIDRPKD